MLPSPTKDMSIRATRMQESSSCPTVHPPAKQNAQTEEAWRAQWKRASPRGRERKIKRGEREERKANMGEVGGKERGRGWGMKEGEACEAWSGQVTTGQAFIIAACLLTHFNVTVTSPRPAQACPGPVTHHQVTSPCPSRPMPPPCPHTNAKQKDDKMERERHDECYTKCKELESFKTSIPPLTMLLSPHLFW